MSLELPEAYILARQMNKELIGREIANSILQNHEKLQGLGFINKDASAFERLVGGKIEFVISRGNVIRVKLENGMNLLLAPEYGGTVLYHAKPDGVPSKFHLKLGFKDNSTLTVRLTGMGVIQAFKDDELELSYVYKRDFSPTASPIEETEFTLERFSRELTSKKINIKAALVGREAVIVGLSNSAFQDVIYRAKIHPKRKASDLTLSEQKSLHNAIKLLIQERIKSHGKSQFIDLYGKQGLYEPAMGPNMKDKTCGRCHSKVEKLNLGGGQTYFCPNCQH